jgi:hypothetical protein
MRTYISRLFLPALLVGLVLICSCSREEPFVAPPLPIIPGEVMMNEIFSVGVTGNLDWIEIYNPSSLPIDISAYKIYDVGGQGGTKTKKGFPAGTVVPAKGFYVVTTDTNTSATIADGFGLSGTSGETVWLDNAAGTIIDICAFPAMSGAQTWGRLPDGGTTWQLLGTVTRGTANKQ